MRIIGIDTPRGWTILDVAAPGAASLVALGTLDAGREAAEMVELVDRYNIERVAIEAPLQPYIGGRAADGGPGVRRAIVTSLLGVARLAGRLEGRAEALGLPCSYDDAAAVRSTLGVRGKGETAIDRDVARIVSLRVRGWPKVSNVDERDAAMVALFAGMRAQNGAACASM